MSERTNYQACSACSAKWFTASAVARCPRCGSPASPAARETPPWRQRQLNTEIEPYYQRDGITIYHGDCREVLPRLGVDIGLVLTDPPYSERTHRGARTNRAGAPGSKLIDFESMNVEQVAQVFELAARQLTGWLVSFIDWRYLSHLDQHPPAGLRFVRAGVWNKPNGTPQITGDRPAQGWEAIAILHAKETRLCWNGHGNRAVWTFNTESGLHPAQKPLPLVKQLASLFTTPGQVVLDPFMGSGTVLRAAKDVGCSAIGIELEERYCETAANRLRQEVLF